MENQERGYHLITLLLVFLSLGSQSDTIDSEIAGLNIGNDTFVPVYGFNLTGTNSSSTGEFLFNSTHLMEKNNSGLAVTSTYLVEEKTEFLTKKVNVDFGERGQVSPTVQGQNTDKQTSATTTYAPNLANTTFHVSEQYSLQNGTDSVQEQFENISSDASGDRQANSTLDGAHENITLENSEFSTPAMSVVTVASNTDLVSSSTATSSVAETSPTDMYNNTAYESAVSPINVVLKPSPRNRLNGTLESDNSAEGLAAPSYTKTTLSGVTLVRKDSHSDRGNTINQKPNFFGVYQLHRNHGLIWEEHDYLLTVLVPVGGGVLGALAIVLLAFAFRNCSAGDQGGARRRRPAAGSAHTTSVLSRKQAVDQVLLLVDSSDEDVQ